MPDYNNISILGAGSMGCALAKHLSEDGRKVMLWSPVIDEIEMLEKYKEHATRLPGVTLNENVSYTTEIDKAAKWGDMIVLAIPSQTTRANARAIAPHVAGKIIVTCSKGIESGTGKLLAEILEEEIDSARIVVLSGPSHAEEIARKVPTAVVAASRSIDDAQTVQDVFMNEHFRVYTNEDVIGVELGGALKNVIALCAGISDGLGFGDNTKAALMTRGMAEIERLGVAMGANPNTFYGLTGIGDLIVTCTSMHSRNRKAGILIGQGMKADKAIERVQMTVEGYSTCTPAYELGKKLGVSMPITTEAYNVLFNGKDPGVAVMDLMGRDKKHEVEQY
jgi:glycerol-3-phosphate dehydrogenase (NAD(P)+)